MSDIKRPADGSQRQSQGGAPIGMQRSQAIQRIVTGNPTASTEEIVKLLKNQGFEVRPGRVEQLRTQKQSSPASRAPRKGATVVAPPRAPKPEMRQELQNRVQVIRQVVAQHPKATPDELVTLLKDQGIQVRPERVAISQRHSAENTGMAPSPRTQPTHGSLRNSEPASDEIETHGDAIRNAIVQNPDALPWKIVQILKSQGTDVQLVTVRHMKRATGHRSTAPIPTGDPKLLRAQRFVQAVGGLRQAKELLASLEQTPDLH